MRFEVEARMSPSPPGMPDRMKQTIVADGEYLWVDAPSPIPPRTVFRGRMDVLEKERAKGKAESVGDPGRMLEEWTRRYKMSVLGEEEAEGRRVIVLEGVPRPDAPAEEEGDPMSSMLKKEIKSALIKVGKEDGFAYSFELRGAPDAPPLEVKRFSNVRWNPTLDPALFKFTMPPGATLQEMTAEPGPASKPGGAF